MEQFVGWLLDLLGFRFFWSLRIKNSILLALPFDLWFIFLINLLGVYCLMISFVISFLGFSNFFVWLLRNKNLFNHFGSNQYVKLELTQVLPASLMGLSLFLIFLELNQRKFYFFCTEKRTQFSICVGIWWNLFVLMGFLVKIWVGYWIMRVVSVGFGFSLFLVLWQRFLAGDSDRWFCQKI